MFRVQRRLGVVAVVLTLTTGCSCTMPLFAPLKEACAQREAPCRIRLSELVDAPWDRVAFVVGDHADAAALGVDTFEPVWLENAIVFMEGTRVVRRDRMPYHSGWIPTVDPDPIYDGTVFLDDVGTAPFVAYARGDDTFEVREETSEAGDTLWLRHVPAE